MADLVIIAYPDVATAEASRAKLIELQKEYLVELGDAVVAERLADGSVASSAYQHHCGGRRWPARCGALVGLFAGRCSGAAAGAAGGAINTSTDVGLDDEFLKDAAEPLAPEGQAALCVLVRKGQRRIRCCRPWRILAGPCCAT